MASETNRILFSLLFIFLHLKVELDLDDDDDCGDCICREESDVFCVFVSLMPLQAVPLLLQSLSAGKWDSSSSNHILHFLQFFLFFLVFF